MALDWKFIQNAATKELAEDQDDARAEVLFDQLIQYNLNGSESIEQLRKLFECSKQVMRFKANQVDIAIEEIDELENIISRENLNQKNLKSTLDRSVEKQAEQQLLELERTNELLRTQLNEKDVELNRVEQSKSALEQTLKLNERQLSNYGQEIEQLREELHIEKEQINEQLADNNLPFEQLRDMNKKFYMLLEEMKDMETMNTQLGEKVMKLNDELNSATQQIHTATSEIQYMRNSLHNLQEMNDLLINEKEDHLNEIRRLKSLTDNYELESDEHSDSSSIRIQNLLEKLKSKEDELNELRSQFASIDRKQMDEEKNCFLKEISKRDNHIKLLRNQLSQAIDDIEAQSRVIENLIEKNIETIHKTGSLDAETCDENRRVMNSNQLINKLEEELRAKDKEMTILHQRNTLYEQGVYGLSEAVEEIDRLSKLIKSKDGDIDKLINELNAINLRLSNTKDELDYLKEIMNADEDLKMKLTEESDVKNDKLKILKLQKEVIRLDAEKLKLYEELLAYKFDTSFGGKKTQEHQNFDSTKKATNTSTSVQDTAQLQKLNMIQELENENRELQLAMKEILIGLKDSDSRSDVIIDCPSLERLCQFFESRSINSNLANVIALKAELDILRGHNEELRMSNKRLRNDIFKIFENYSKHLLTDFMNKHHLEHDLKDETKNEGGANEVINTGTYINQTLTEDELYDSDLSEGEIVLNSRTILPSRKQNQEIQTGLGNRPMIGLELDQKEQNESAKINDSTSGSSDENLGRENSSTFHQKHDETNQCNGESTNQRINDSKNSDEPTYESSSQRVNEKPSIDRMTQTDLCMDDLRNVNYLMRVDEIEEILKFASIDELKDLTRRKSLSQRESVDKAESSKINSKDATSQTIAEQSAGSVDAKCSQCSLVQELLIEFQNKIDRIDLGVMQREDLYTERISVLQADNNRLQNEMQQMVQMKDDLLNQKEKEIIELNDKIVDQKEKIVHLEKCRSEMKSEEEIMNESIDKPVESAKLEKQNADSQLNRQGIDGELAIIHKTPFDSMNQRGLINILETIIKCLQTRIEHKDGAIAHYQQLLTKTQEEHQQEIQKLMKNYKKITEHSIKAIQSTTSVNQEQLETTLVKYNDQLNEFKVYHQKVLVEQKKALELQSCKMKRLKNENERLKSQTVSSDELNRLRSENEHLNKLIDKNAKFIEKLKNAIKEERAYKQEPKYEANEQEPGKVMQLSKLREETEHSYKLLISKDKQIKELHLNKWNLEKKINELIQTSKRELKAKTDELEKMMHDQVKLKNLLEKMEKEKSSLRRKQVIVVKETNSISKIDRNTQTDKMVNFDLNNRENSMHDIFKQLDQTVVTHSQQHPYCAQRENELIGILEQNSEFRGREQTNSVRHRKESFIKSIKGRTFEISKKNSCDF